MLLLQKCRVCVSEGEAKNSAEEEKGRIDMESLDLLEPAEQLQTITVTHSPRGVKLQQPLTLKVPRPRNRGEEDLHRYIIESLSWKMPRLVSLTFSNNSMLELAKHLLRHCTGSTATLYQYMYGIYRFCNWVQTSPDKLISSCLDEDGDPNPKAIARYVRLLDEFVGCLKADGLAPGTISNHVKSVKALYRMNGLRLELPYRLPKRTIYSDRSPTPEELQRLIDIADLREKVIISSLALGGFRIGTLAKLKYRHIKRDYERGITPIHVHVETEITKGKYHDYDTFLGEEATEYVRAYLDYRKQGSACGKMPPEPIHEESPLVRNSQSRRSKPITPSCIHRITHNLYLKAGVIQRDPHGRKSGRRYELRAHSIRKYFRTQMAALGVERDYIEYMMGHTISTYHDIRMKGIEFLRGIYVASGLSIKPKTRVSKMDALKEIIRAWGLNPEEILTRKALSQPHRTYIDPNDREQEQIRELSHALKETIIEELLKANQKTV
jgi:hypothetical protein